MSFSSNRIDARPQTRPSTVASKKLAGGWSSVAMVEKYAHLAPKGQEQAIREFLGLGCDDSVTAAA